jgi:ribonuclease VapC
MSAVTVLDASAVLAFLQGKPGHQLVQQALQSQRCVVTAANHAKIIAKALDRGVTADAVRTILAALSYSVIDTQAEDGVQAGLPRPLTGSAGLSLGDRLCLASAQRLNAPVVTADRAWVSVAPALGLTVRCIRDGAH